jgi:hypothetical protein
MSRQARVVLFILPVFLIMIAGILFFNPMPGSGFKSSCKTQTIIYRSKSDSATRIEFQMQDIGAFGYNSRTVKVSPGYFFDSVQEIDIAGIDTLNWIKVDELELKGG